MIAHPRTTQTSTLAPELFFADMLERFEQASSAGGSVSRCYHLGGATVRLVFAGTGIIPSITPALAHRAIPPTDANLTVYVWDSVTTGVPIPPAPWTTRRAPEADLYRRWGDIPGYSKAGMKIAYSGWSGVLSILDLEQNQAMLWLHDAYAVPIYVRSSPLLTILHWWFRERGIQLTHAAVVGTSRSGVLLAGPGGAGKSTTALTCLSAGLSYVGDDYVLLAGDPSLTAHALYSSAKLRNEQVAHFPNLWSALANAATLDQEKALFWLAEHVPAQLVESLPVRAILIPRISGITTTTLQRASAGDSLAAVAPSTLFQLPGSGASDFQRLSRFVQQVPSYILHLSSDLTQIPAIINRVLEGELPDV